ncbi:hypothetical protein PTI98_003481 [Pleurotus ostreatus]|nr:hypothetical protein PTI98_003481 [Pleurotus ostreatus]
MGNLNQETNRPFVWTHFASSISRKSSLGFMKQIASNAQTSNPSIARSDHVNVVHSYIPLSVHCFPNRGSYRPVLAWIKDCIDHLISKSDLRQLTIRTKVYCFHPIKVFDYPTLEDHQELSRVIEPLHRHGVLECVKLEFATENWPFKPIPADMTKEIITMQQVFAALLEGGPFAVDTEYWE